MYFGFCFFSAMHWISFPFLIVLSVFNHRYYIFIERKKQQQPFVNCIHFGNEVFHLQNAKLMRLQWKASDVNFNLNKVKKKETTNELARAHQKSLRLFSMYFFFQILIVYAAFSDRSMIIFFCTHFNTISVKNDYLNTYSPLHDCHYSSKSMSSIYNFRWFIRVLLLFCISALFEISESFKIHTQIATQKKFPTRF